MGNKIFTFYIKGQLQLKFQHWGQRTELSSSAFYICVTYIILVKFISLMVTMCTLVNEKPGSSIFQAGDLPKKQRQQARQKKMMYTYQTIQ